MGHTNNIPEARCPKCGWEGLWEEVDMEVLYRETRLDPAVCSWACPLCGTELDALDTLQEGHNDGTTQA